MDLKRTKMAAKKKAKKPLYTVIMKHNAGADARMKTVDDYEEAAKIAHDFFLSYFDFVDGKLVDPGNPGQEDEVFEDVKIHKKKYVVEFIHFGGEGPCLSIEKTGSI
jgi:hypothetical protein